MAGPDAQRHEQRFLLECVGSGIRQGLRKGKTDARSSIGSRKGFGLVLMWGSRLGLPAQAQRDLNRQGPVYSALSACTGSIDAARCAGMIPAMKAAKASVRMAPPTIGGSAAVIS